MIRSDLLNVLLVCVSLTFMVTSLGLSTYSVVKVGNNSCGSVHNFAYSESIQPELKQTLFQDVIKPNGCNQCSDHMHVPIWLAPGDMCDMQQTYGLLTYHPTFQHCHIANYATDFNPTDHVKACVTKEDVTYLWESGHCHYTSNTTSLPFFERMKEGLLFCAREIPIMGTNMAYAMRQDAIHYATRAVKKNIAAFVENEFDNKYKPRWRCIVGPGIINVRSHVTDDTAPYIYFVLGQMNILLYKSG